MDYSADSTSGQQKVIIGTDLLQHIADLCDFMQMLRAWWEHFERVIRQLDRAAAVKAYDLMIEGVVLARQIARELGFQLPDTSTVDWSLSPRPPATSVDL